MKGQCRPANAVLAEEGIWAQYMECKGALLYDLGTKTGDGFGGSLKGAILMGSYGFRIGLDLVSLARVEEMYETRQFLFLERFFTGDEIEFCLLSPNPRRQIESMAGSIAAKEAVMKVLGEGWPKIPWTDIEIVRKETGRPVACLKGKALELMEEENLQSIPISITHDGQMAAAVAIGVPK